MAQTPPPAFYRVQHAKSFTLYDESCGFKAQGFYPDEFYEYFVNHITFESHLDWHARPQEPTPYISLFDNLYDAVKRAHFHMNKGHHDIFIAEIQPGEVESRTLHLYFREGGSWLPDLPTCLANTDWRNVHCDECDSRTFER